MATPPPLLAATPKWARPAPAPQGLGAFVLSLLSRAAAVLGEQEGDLAEAFVAEAEARRNAAENAAVGLQPMQIAAAAADRQWMRTRSRSRSRSRS